MTNNCKSFCANGVCYGKCADDAKDSYYKPVLNLAKHNATVSYYANTAAGN